MRKIATLIALLFVLTKGYSQCTPDLTMTSPGIFPPALTTACVNSPYTDTVNIVFKEDTVLFGFTLAMDSVKVTNVLNLPAGMNYSCGNGSCKYICVPPQLTYGCLLIDGTPTTVVPTGHMIQINFTYWVTVPFVGGITVLDSVAVGLGVSDCSGIANVNNPEISIYPNPAQDQLLVQVGEDALSSDCTLRIYNANGQLVRTAKITELSSTIQLNDLNDGMYFVMLESGQRIIMREHLLIQK
ncbi:MAG: T9SS type A sorting domain-containing protein [Bacteroidota bacterium]